MPRVANGVEVRCKRALASSRAAVVEALVDLVAGTGKSCGKKYNVLAMRSARVRGMVPSIYTVGAPDAAVVGCLVYYNSRAWRC